MSEISFTRKDRRKVDLIVCETEKEVHSALIEATIFVIALTSVTILAVNSQHFYWFYANNLLRRMTVDSFQEKTVRFDIEKIKTVEGFWVFLEGHLMPTLESVSEDPPTADPSIKDPIGLHGRQRILGVNILLHLPRLRQIRIKPKRCKKHRFLEKYFTECFEPYDPSDQETDEFYKGSKFYDTKTSGIRPVWAVVEKYSEGGYVKFLPIKNAKSFIRELRQMEWIDRGTRLVVLSLPLYNINMGLLENVKIMAEVLPTGSVVCSYFGDILPLHSVWSTRNPGTLITACIFYIIVTYNIGNEIFEIYKCGLKEYFKVTWNYFDWGVILSSLAALAMSILYPINIDQFFEDIRIKKVTASIDEAGFHHTVYVGSLALSTFLLWIRIFRFISFNETMYHFNLALRRCAPEIFGFALILLITFMAFAIIGLLSFGTKHSDFVSFPRSFIFMFRLMLRDFDFEYFDEVDPVWGPIYFMCYILIVIFILVNMFIAIMSQTYFDVKQLPGDNKRALGKVINDSMQKVKSILKTASGKLFKKSELSQEVQETTGPQRIIQLSEEPNSTERVSGDVTDTPRPLSESEALKEYFGVEPSKSSMSTDGSYRTIEDDSEKVSGENQRVVTSDLVYSLNDRLNLLEKAYNQLNLDLDTLIANLDKKTKKSGSRKFEP